MRILKGVVGIQAIVLAVLLALLIQRADVAPPPALVGRTGTEAAPDVVREQASLLRTAAAASAASPDAERVHAPPAADDLVVLQGRLLGIDPPPTDDAVRLTCRRDDGWRSSNVLAGVYADAALAAGPWRSTCEVEGCVKQEFDHVLTTAPVQRLDLTLEPAVVLPVFVRTTDGARLMPQLTELGIWQGLQVIAVETPVLGDFAPTEQTSIGDVGLGRHRIDGDLDQRREADGDDGRLELDRPPPLHAVLLLRHLVLAQQPIVPGQRELRFEVDLAAVKARFAKVRLRIVDASGQPVHTARVQFSSAQGGGSAGKPDAQGGITIEHALPGLAHFAVWAKDLEQYAAHVTLPAGETTDLGDLVLTSPRTVRGRLVDADGVGRSGGVQWTAIDAWRPPHPMQDRRSTSADGDGNFELALGARRYVVAGRAADGRVGYTIVDGDSAAVAPFEIPVAEPTTVRLVVSDAFATFAVVVRDPAGDLLDVQRLEPRWREAPLRLPPGDYRVEVFDGHGVFVRRAPLRVGTAPVQLEVP